jgi:hypothetical protein
MTLSLPKGSENHARNRVTRCPCTHYRGQKFLANLCFDRGNSKQIPVGLSPVIEPDDPNRTEKSLTEDLLLSLQIPIFTLPKHQAWSNSQK